MKAIITALSLLCILAANAIAGSGLTIDKFEKSDVDKAKKEVGFTTLLEGRVGDPSQDVFVFVYQPHLKAWRVFPATTEIKPEAGGGYRWRAVCLFGEFKGTGKNEDYQIIAYALDKRAVVNGLPKKIPAQTLKSEVLVLKRVR